MTKEHVLRVTVNGARRSLTVRPATTLAQLLAGEAACESVREQCADGRCGACLVSVDGALVHACLVLALQADGASVVTAEGVPERGVAARVRRVLADSGGCPDCTGTIVLNVADAARRRLPDGSLLDALSENACACGAAQRIWPQIEELLASRRQAAQAAERVSAREARRRRARPSAPAPGEEPQAE